MNDNFMLCAGAKNALITFNIPGKRSTTKTVAQAAQLLDLSCSTFIDRIESETTINKTVASLATNAGYRCKVQKVSFLAQTCEKNGDTTKDHKYPQRLCFRTDLEVTVADTVDKTVGILQTRAPWSNRSTIRDPHGARVSFWEPRYSPVQAGMLQLTATVSQDR